MSNPSELSYSQEDLDALEKRLLRRVERERLARKEAENLLEDKSLDLFLTNRQLQALNTELEKKVEERTLQLSEALKKAEVLAKAKSEFLATMSHELRTPMNAVIGLSDILLSSELTSEQTQLMNTLRHSGSNLLALINDILEFSKLDVEHAELDIKPYSLKKITHEICEIFELKAQSKQLKLHIQIDEKIPEPLFLDGARLKQVLFHLVSNAVKFTKQGHINVNIQQLADNRVLFEVIDSGIGIHPEAQATLFEVFTQADNSMNREYQGTGLGLALSFKILRAMHSELKVESTPNQGSRFYFELPMHQQTHPTLKGKVPADINVVENQTINSNLRILITDDNPVNLMLAMKLIEKLGLQPHQAKDGLEAVELIESETYDIIFMDVQMPTMDGLQATQFIRKLGSSIQQPRIIALTANSFDEDKQNCFNAGMDAFLSKPITLDRLKSQILIEQNNLSKHHH